jgi:hypothetical protein
MRKGSGSNLVALSAIAIFVVSFAGLCIASWYPPSKPEYLIEACKAAFKRI